MPDGGSKLAVELVSPDRLVWQGEADLVVVKTVEGEIGIMPNHSPVLAELAEGSVMRVIEGGQQKLIAAVHGGFISMSRNEIQVLSEAAELGDEVDVAAARTALERALATIDQDEDAAAEAARARAQLRAAGADH
jgi:F-type H+-transporting ATPase subunit epsilon